MKETNLEKAKRLYPIGTEYIPIDIYGIQYTNNDTCMATISPVEYNSSNTIAVGIGYIYANNNWAEIVTPKRLTSEDFKEGDIVRFDARNTTVKVVKNITSFKNCISVEKETGTREWNSCNIDYNKIRFATPEEISKTVWGKVEKWSVGTYILVLKDLSDNYVKGTIDEIIISDSTTYIKVRTWGTMNKDREEDDEIKWFATKEEAEAFRKTMEAPKPCYKDLPKEELIAFANRKYPIGTRFMPFEGEKTIREVQPFNGRKSSSPCIFSYSIEKGVPVIRSSNGMLTKDVYGSYACSNPAVYVDGKWAEIVVDTASTIEFGKYPPTPEECFIRPEQFIVQEPLNVVSSTNKIELSELKLISKSKRKRLLTLTK